ncbi:carbohydrate porin [Novosphingobium terrae]|uniref:carbohydrate porin n=1 Tax=Novosphingobium terrae TaxID=2726189 RepID=UPI00197CDE14|nr:carbohydrate porin [Novosphingobium terrae]
MIFPIIAVAVSLEAASNTDAAGDMQSASRLVQAETPVADPSTIGPQASPDAGGRTPLVLDQPTAAAAPKASDFDQTISGRWGGLRTRLLDAGINTRGDFVAEPFASVRGGQARGTSYAQQLRLGADFDMHKIAGWSGGIFHLTLNDRKGGNISTDLVGNRLPIQESAGGDFTRLSELSFEDDLFNHRMTVKVGFYSMGNDLGGMSILCSFVNAAFCAHPLSESGNSGWTNYPNSRWGAEIKYRINGEVIVRTGVYQVNQSYNEPKYGFDLFAPGTSGAIFPLELEYDPNNQPGSKGLRGQYKFGVFYDTVTVNRQGVPGTVGGRYGLYLLANQMIYREAGSGMRGLTVFGEFTANPRASAQITRWYGAGLLYRGALRNRPDDVISFGVVTARVNPQLLEAHEKPVNPSESNFMSASLAGGETAIEISYGLSLKRGISLRPDFQYIINPGAFSFQRNENNVSLGMQIKMQL